MLRVARGSDGPSVAAIYRPYVEGGAATFEEEAPSGAAMARKIERASYPFLAFEDRAAGEGSEVLGFAYAGPADARRAYRWTAEEAVFVRPDAQGRGIGGALLGALVQLLRELGYARVRAVIAAPNPAAVALHRGRGFSPVCSLPRGAYKLGAWRDLDLMELILREPRDFPPGVQPLEPLDFAEFARANTALLAAILRGPSRPAAYEATAPGLSNWAGTWRAPRA